MLEIFIKKDGLGLKYPFNPCLTLLLSIFLASNVTYAQEKPLGTVTALQGEARLTRAAAQTALRFREGLLLRDIVNTQEKSLIRILFGEKSSVTVRELTRFEVHEEVLPSDANRSVYELSSGALLLRVARELMRSGDEVQIQTPNATAAIRGTTIIAEYFPERFETVFTLVTGSALVTPEGGASIPFPPLSAIRITGTPALGLEVSPIEAVPPSEVAMLLEGFELGRMVKGEANLEQNWRIQIQIASQLANALLQPITDSASESETLLEETISTVMDSASTTTTDPIISSATQTLTATTQQLLTTTQPITSTVTQTLTAPTQQLLTTTQPTTTSTTTPTLTAPTQRLPTLSPSTGSTTTLTSPLTGVTGSLIQTTRDGIATIAP